MLIVHTVPNMFHDAEREIAAHGCNITHYGEYSEITFPEGTTRGEILPRMSGGERFKLVLPDGYVMYQQYVRHLDQYILFYSREGMLTGQGACD